ncbi:MAG: response regulator transcription factor, partial [Candidatus Aminicenantes bacterium]|nr:response regulator transcription factor [Candidatus Aminicenantes bacterium]
MQRCVIVDDESGAVEILSDYVNRHHELELLKTFRDSIEALTFLTRSEVDLVFLDIDMPNLDGMQFAELMRGRNIQVIFCTAYSEYAVESYEKEAVDYLLKPIGYERFCQAVDKASARKSLLQPLRSGGKEFAEGNGKINKLFIKSGSRIHKVDIPDVLFIEKKGHYVIFHTSGKQLLSRMSMNDLLQSLPSDHFVRIHRSFVVAVDKINTIEKQAVVIQTYRI